MERKCKQGKYFENKKRKKITNGNMITKSYVNKNHTRGVFRTESKI